jgi:hypothetical protein
MSIHLDPFTVYRARLILTDPIGMASSETVRGTLQALGFGQVWVYWSIADLPADWPDDKKADVSQWSERPVWVHAYYQGDPVDAPDSGPMWRIVDMWVHATDVPPIVDPQQGPPTPPDIDPPPTDAGGNTPGASGTPWTGKSKHAWALPIARAAIKTVLGQDNPAAVQLLMAMATFESNYGWPSNKTWRGHHNWGAVYCPCMPPCKAGTFEVTDWTIENGVKRPVKACALSFPTDEDGAVKLAETLLIQHKVGPVLETGNLLNVCRKLRDGSYFCPTIGRNAQGRPDCQAVSDAAKQKDARAYARHLDRKIKEITAQTGVPRLLFMPDQARPSPLRTALVIAAVGVGAIGVAMYAERRPHG